MRGGVAGRDAHRAKGSAWSSPSGELFKGNQGSGLAHPGLGGVFGIPSGECPTAQPRMNEPGSVPDAVFLVDRKRIVVPPPTTRLGIT